MGEKRREYAKKRMFSVVKREQGRGSHKKGCPGEDCYEGNHLLFSAGQGGEKRGNLLEERSKKRLSIFRRKGERGGKGDYLLSGKGGGGKLKENLLRERIYLLAGKRRGEGQKQVLGAFFHSRKSRDLPHIPAKRESRTSLPYLKRGGKGEGISAIVIFLLARGGGKKG